MPPHTSFQLTRPRPSRTRWLIRGVALAGIVWFVWMLFGLHVDDPGGVVTVQQAEAMLQIKLPANARNVRVAQFHQWIAYGQYLRCEAPVADCYRAAAALLPAATSQPADEVDLAAAAKPVMGNVFRDFGWFDIDKATNVCTYGGGPSIAQVWIDQDKGVFYYRKTD